MKKEKTLSEFLLGINGIHIILCLAVMLLRKYKIFGITYVDLGILVLTLLVWLVFAYLTALGLNMLKGKNAFTYSLLSVVPIFIITLVSAALGFFTSGSTAGWAKFFFIGSTVNFFFRPFSALLEYISFSAYLYYLICIVLLVLVSLVGAGMGISSGKKKVRNKKTKSHTNKTSEASRKEESSSRRVSEKKAPKKESSSSELSEASKKMSDEQLANETNEDLQKEIERLQKKLDERQQKGDA